MTPERRTTILRIISLIVVVAISVWIFSIRDQASELAKYGYPGIFIISLLANATVLLPAPGVAVVFAMGGVFNPLIVGIVAGVGGAIGEISGYLAGYSGQAVIQRGGFYDRIHPYMEKFGPATIFVLALIPNPFFDLGGVAAGALKMPLLTFLTWCTLGKILKMLVFAYSGYYSVDWFFALSQ